MFNLNGKNIIISGGNGFLGRVYCELVSEMGGNPIVLDVNLKDIKTFLLDLKNKYNNEPSYYLCDISDYKKVKKIYNKIILKYKNFHALVNNAAINPKFNKLKKSQQFLENFDLDSLKREIEVGLYGAINCTKIFGYHLAKKKYGSIVNISSDLGVIAPNHNIYNFNKTNRYDSVKPVSYSIIKSAIIGLTRYTSTYWAKDNIRCNALAPGGVFENQDKKFVKKISSLIPLGRMANANELKGPIGFLLSDESSYVNGQILLVDGGRSTW